MKTATVADLRNNFHRVSAWIESGESVEIRKRGKAFAMLTAVRKPNGSGEPPRVDFLAQLREVWGPREFTDAKVAEMRRDELEGEEG